MDIRSANPLGILQAASTRSPSKKGASNESGESFQQALAQASNDDSKMAKVGKQFEALIVGQVLKAAREASDGGWLGTGDDQTGELALEMAEQGFAQAVAARGGLGISKSVLANLHRSAASSVKAASSEPSEQH
jgi:peptidoglycan hydrolase FlgJ